MSDKRAQELLDQFYTMQVELQEMDEKIRDLTLQKAQLQYRADGISEQLAVINLSAACRTMTTALRDSGLKVTVPMKKTKDKQN